jgi:uncharacterized protein YoxC
VGQLDIITKTLHILEQRMRVTESQVGQLMDRVNEGPKLAAPLEVHPNYLSEEVKDKEPTANPLIEAEKEDLANYNSAQFKGNIEMERAGVQMEPRSDV